MVRWNWVKGVKPVIVIHTESSSDEDLRSWIRNRLWDQVPVSIGVISPDFRVVEANRAFRDSYGDWHGRRCWEVYKGRQSRCERCAAAETFVDGRVRISEEQGVVREDGNQVHYLVHMVPLVTADGEIPYVIEMSTDITATKILEKEKIDAERLAAVGQTVAGLAHGVKNVLMGLEGGMYVVRSGMKRGDSQRMLDGWRMLEENIDRISAFVKEFLEFARGRVPRVAVVDPNEIARRVCDLFRETAAMKGIEVVFRPDPRLAPAPMDAEGIHECLSNLVSNALDACEISDAEHPQVVVSTREENGVIVLEVADNGTGMDYEVKKKVFTNFFSTKQSGKGTGLGLLTTRKIVHEHGGRVSFDSAVGVGSTFRLEFPRDRLPTPGDSAAVDAQAG